MSWRTTAALSVLMACSSTSDDARGSSSALKSTLDGHQYLLTSATGFSRVSGTTVHLSFDDGSLGASAGCNGIGGGYDIDDGTLWVTELGITNRACGSALEAQDSALAAFLDSKPAIALVGDELTLTGASTTLVFLDREVAEPDRALVGTKWKVDALIVGDAVSSYESAPPVQIVFASDGSFRVTSPCNGAAGHYTAQPPRITLRDVGWDDSECAPATRSIDAQLRAVFANTLSYEIEANTLTLQNGARGLSAHESP